MAREKIMICEPRSESDESPSSATVWSEICRAQEPGACLNRVVERYTARIEAYARKKWGGRLQGHVDDYTQSFLLKMLEGRVVRHADRTKGRFRRFLLRSFNNHVIDILRKKSVALADDLESIPGNLLEPSELDRICAEEMLREAGYAVARICRERQAGQIYKLISDQIIDPILHGTERLSQDELAAKYGFVSRSVVSGKMRTARKWFRQAVKHVISQYAPEDEFERELSDFIAVIPNAMRFEDPEEGSWGCLHSHMVCDLEKFDPIGWARAQKHSEYSNRALQTYIELLADEAPPLTLLTLVKRFAKHQLSGGDGLGTTSRLPRPAAKLLYYLAISVAREKHCVGRSFSALNAHALARGLATCRQRAKEDPQINSLLEQHLDANAT